jgi:hypothetical protein
MPSPSDGAVTDSPHASHFHFKGNLSGTNAGLRLAMSIVSHRPTPIASLWKFKLHHYRADASFATISGCSVY